MTTTTSPTLPSELLAKAAEAIRALPMWGGRALPRRYSRVRRPRSRRRAGAVGGALVLAGTGRKS